MNIIRFCFVNLTILLFLYCPSRSMAQTINSICKGLFEQQAYAYIADDFVQTENIIQKIFDIGCLKVFDSELKAILLENLGHITFKRKEYENSLKLSEACIETHYSNYSCHILKIDTFINTGKFIEACSATEIARKLVRLLIDNKKREIDSSIDRKSDLHSLNIAEYKALERAKKILQDYFEICKK